MSVPIIAGAGSLQLAEVAAEGMDRSQAAMFVAGFVSSAVVGYLAIRFFLRFVVHHSLRAFSYYRFGLAAVVAVLLLLGVGGEF
jgi:undecaprenyl-diphosphatase